MSCKQKTGISLVLCVVTVAFYKPQICDSVSLGKLNDLGDFTPYQGEVSASAGWERVKPKNYRDTRHAHLNSGGRVIIRGAPLPKSARPPESAVFPGEPLTHLSKPKLGETDISLAQKATNVSWIFGNITEHPRPSASEVAYQADFTGFQGVQGKVLGPSFDSSPHFSEWLAMRPLVQCDDNIMTFTASASGQGYTHLLVDREDASPISLFQLPPDCGYSVRTSWRDLVMMAPYDGCYITQENGSYVLPLLWWGNPLKLSCPVQAPTSAPSASHSAPSVLCSPYGMAVHIYGKEDYTPLLGVMVNGEWAPFVSAECAHPVDSRPGQLMFFVPFGAPCVTVADGLHLLLLLDGQGYTISCPLYSSLFPSFPSSYPPMPPGDPQYPRFPDPVTPAPTSPSSPPPPPPPQPPTQEQPAQLPDYLHYHYPGLQYPQLPQAYPPAPQPARPSRPTPGSPPGPQSHQSLYPTEPGQLPYSPGDHSNHHSLPYRPSEAAQATSAPNLTARQDSPPLQLPKLPVGPPQYPSGVYFPYVPFYYPQVTPPLTPSTEETATAAPPATPPHTLPKGPYHAQYDYLPYYPSPTAAPVTQGPAPALPPPPPPPPSETPKRAQHPDSPFYPPDSYRPYYYYYPYGSVVYPEKGTDARSTSLSPPPPPPPATTTTSVMRMLALKQPVDPSYSSGPKQPVGPSYSPHPHYWKRPTYFPPPTPPPAEGTPPPFHQHLQNRTGPLTPAVPTAQPEAQRATCPPYAHTLCSYYPYYYYPHYHPPYPPHYHPYYPHIPLYSSPATPTEQPSSSTPTSPSTTTITTTAASAASTSTEPAPLSPTLQCLEGRMVAFLPSAHRDSIHVRAEKTWLLLSSVSPLCGYVLSPAEGSGVILQSPLPACHSQQRTPTTISLALKFSDLSMTQYRTLELQCPYEQPSVTPAPVDPTTITPGQTSTSVVPKPKVFCSSRHMTVELPPGPISGIVVQDIKGNQMKLQDAPKHCGYSASKGKGGKISVDLPLNSRCHMSIQGKVHLINITYMAVDGRREAQLSCPLSIPAPSKECNLPSEQRLPCGPGSLSQPQCLSLGCCFSKRPPACYHPMDECSIDRHFVFLVPASLTEPPLSPALLVAAGNSTCKPQRVTSDYALFKIPLDGCGARRIEVGKIVIYIVEILNMVQAITLNYGTITRDSPVRLLIECRYLPGSVVTVSYLVKSPSLGPAVHSQGVIGVQLRIAKDAQYSSYYPQYHQPLQMLVGKPLYLEVRLLNSPDPSLVLLVHYCVAYPRSGTAVWVLLYNGCPNPLDPASQQTFLPPPLPPFPRGQTRRFTITTFQFLPNGKSPDMDEEIYFMCSTEVCSPLDGPCVEGCFGE